MKITNDEIYRSINKDSKINFVGYAVTLLQADGIDLCQKVFEEKDIPLKGFALMIAHSVTGQKVTSKSFLNNSQNIKPCYYTEEEYTLLNRIKAMLYSMVSACFRREKNKRVLYIAWTNVLDYMLYNYEKNIYNTFVKFIILDDGESSYADSLRDRLNMEVARNPNSPFVVSYLRCRMKEIYFKLLYKKLKEKGRIIDNRLFSFKEKGDQWNFVRNADLIKNYVWVLQKKASIINRSKISFLSNAILISTQCFIENNFTSGGEEFEAYKKTIDAIRQVSNAKVVVKTHPRELSCEKYNNLNCTLYEDSTYPLETLLSCIEKPPLCLISINSSTLLMASGVFSIPTISIAKIMLNDDSISLTKVLRYNFEEYIERYKSIVLMPSSYNELGKMISEMESRWKDE